MNVSLMFIFHIPYFFQFVKCRQFFLELNPKRLYRSSEKAKEIPCLVFTSSRKREIRHFLRRGRAVTAKEYTKKREAPAKLLFCKSKPTAFLTFSLPSPSSLLKLPNAEHKRSG